MVRETTPFAIHSAFTHAKGAVIDYTEYRITRMLSECKSHEIKLTLEALLSDYKSGSVAVAWHHGTPCAVPVMKDKL